MEPLKRIVALGLVSAIAVAAKGERPAADSSDAILDRLEKNLLNHEQESLSFSERLINGGKSNDKGVRRYRYDGAAIEADLPEYRDIKKLKDAVGGLEKETEQFVNDVALLKQQVLTELKNDSVVKVKVKFLNPDLLNVRNLNIILDDFPLYTLPAHQGAWVPDGDMLVYEGPMPPGSHRLELRGGFTVKAPDPVPLHNDSYNVVENSFSLDVPPGKFTKEWVIVVSGAQKSGKLEAKIENPEK